MTEQVGSCGNASDLFETYIFQISAGALAMLTGFSWLPVVHPGKCLESASQFTAVQLFDV
jgi:hypothetical protein